MLSYQRHLLPFTLADCTDTQCLERQKNIWVAAAALNTLGLTHLTVQSSSPVAHHQLCFLSESILRQKTFKSLSFKHPQSDWNHLFRWVCFFHSASGQSTSWVTTRCSAPFGLGSVMMSQRLRSAPQLYSGLTQGSHGGFDWFKMKRNRLLTCMKAPTRTHVLTCFPWASVTQDARKPRMFSLIEKESRTFEDDQIMSYFWP